ncbi:PAS domain-containing sensor histidine kinase [Calothrix sp. UHCC 0171]|uniref:sensor histidine kinase n=1 Tax=Calothrix sp. UHCC 0171 TaxID=3110245 RepID=UPI002B216CA5|nr:PAS domain-containing sensor histidine kinase [Calothrix sp. UHCC 0171]MEA5570518.1 PAS domain-containing sensor histidine kinase [Calothrix sp. UHCC 0171]
MSRKQPSSWHQICREQDNIVSLTPARLELVPERVLDSELRPHEVLQKTQDESLSYRQLYEQLPAIYLVLDHNGIILSVNQFGADSLGFSPEELIGKTVLNLFTSCDRMAVADALISLLTTSKTSKVNHGEFRLDCRQSHIAWVKVVAKTLPGDEQNPLILLVCEDITESKRWQDAYQESEQRFQIMANTAPMMLWKSGCDGLCNFVNEFWLQFTGRSFEQEQGIGWIDNVHPDEQLKCLQGYYSALKNRSQLQMEYRLRHADGEYRWILDTRTPTFTPSGEFTGYIGCCIDVSERKMVEVALLQSQESAQAQIEEMERLDRLKDEFLSTVSHELRTPLTNMKMAIQMLGIALGFEPNLLLENPPSQTHNSKLFRYFQILNNECDREINLINNFLDLQKLDINSKPLVLETVIVQEWLVRVVELFKARHRHCQQNLQIHLNANLPLLVCDPFSLERIIIELLTNACKFSPLDAEITITAQVKSANIEFKVINTGVEIPASECDRIFDKFYRIPSNDPWKQGGTGLGLALVQKLSRYLGGTIAVESSSNQTCFTVLLPLRGE